MWTSFPHFFSFEWLAEQNIHYDFHWMCAVQKILSMTVSTHCCGQDKVQAPPRPHARRHSDVEITSWVRAAWCMESWLNHWRLGAEPAPCGPDTPELLFSWKWKTTKHITIWKCMTIQFTTWFWWHTWASMYEICLNTLSVVSIDYSVFIFSYRFGLAVLLRCRDRKVPAQL